MRALKLSERLNNLAYARRILSGLRRIDVDKSWKMLVEVRLPCNLSLLTYDDRALLWRLAVLITAPSMTYLDLF